MSTNEQTWGSLAGKVRYKPARLADECGVSLRTLQRHFRKTYGTTASDWMRRVRMREAYGRLLKGERVKEVAIDLAYKQISHFSRDFKAAFGVPPSALSQKAQKLKWPQTPPNLINTLDPNLEPLPVVV